MATVIRSHRPRNAPVRAAEIAEAGGVEVIVEADAVAVIEEAAARASVAAEATARAAEVAPGGGSTAGAVEVLFATGFLFPGAREGSGDTGLYLRSSAFS